VQFDATLKPSLLTKVCSACGQTYQPIPIGASPPHICPQSAAAPQELESETAPIDGALIGATLAERYVIESVLDSGGMGIVFVARHVMLANKFAIKVMGRKRSPDDLARFMREAQLLSKLRHPNIVYVQDFGFLPGGLPYLVMELVPGKPLSKLIKKGPIAAPRACRIAIQVARGVQTVHDAGIIHRDLKPENIILTEDRVQGDLVKIIDFGIAKEMAVQAETNEREPPITRVGAFLGSPRYTSPEQANGREIDGRSDQYALGCILYQMLTALPPFDGDTAVDILLLHVTRSPPPPRMRCPELAISASLEGIILRTLSKRRDERFASMDALAQALTSELATPAASTRGWLALGLAAAIAVAIGVGGFAAYRGFRSGGPKPLGPEELAEHRAQAVAALLPYLEAPQAVLRASALLALGHSGDRSLEPRLVSALRSPDALVKRSAAEALGQLGDARARPALGSLLDAEAAPGIKVTAAQAIDNLGDPGGLLFLEKSLRSPDAALARAAALALCARRSQSVRALLTQSLTGKSLAEISDLPLLTCLARIGDKEARGRLQALFEQAPHPEARITVAARLLELGESSGQTFLRGLLRKPGAQQLVAARLLAAPTEPDTAVLFRRTLEDRRARGAVRQLAAEGLGRSGQLEDLRQLGPLLEPAIEAESRVAAAQSILQLIANDPGTLSQQSVAFLRGALSDESPAMRQTAVDVLADDLTHDVVPVLVELTRDLNPQVRQRAVRALGVRASKEAIPTLSQGLADSDAGVRKEAIHALDKAVRSSTASPDEALRALREVLKPVLDSGTEVDQAVARSQLLKLGDPGQLSTLKALKDNQTAEVRLAVVFENSTLPELLRGYLADADWEVRFAAARGLSEFGDKDAIPTLKEAISRGGPDALVAYHGLLRLQVRVPEVPDPDAWMNSSDAALRLRAVESVASLPAEAAMALLERASRDSEPLVRLMVVTVIGDKVTDETRPRMSAITQTLLLDGNGAVRMRARALFARLAQVPPPRPAPSQAPPKLPPADGELLSVVKAHNLAAQTPAASPEPAPVEKIGIKPVKLTVSAAAPVWFHVDGRAWQLASRATLSLMPGSHSVATIDKQQSIELKEGKESPEVALEASALEQLVKSGLQALLNNDVRKGQRALERVQSMCARDRKIDAPCGALSYDLSLRLASVYEEQGRFADAMRELQRLSAPGKGVKASPEQQAAVVIAIGKLGARLGQVILVGEGGKGRAKARGCSEKILWLPPGSHSVNHAGRTFNVTVRAKETVRVGACE
jgi:HEAT repeat protein